MSLSKSVSAARGSFDVVSVDVFDTLLLRDASLQQDRFREVAALLATDLQARGHDIDAVTLLALRQRAHHLAYQAVSIERPDGEAKLTRMSEILVRLLGLDQSLTAVFVAAELAVESRHLSPNRRLIAFMQRLRQEGTRVIAISDMYLSGEEIGGLVTKVVGFLPVDRIYASSDFGLTKQSGRLFTQVAAMEAVPPGRLLHYGDHASADLARARAAGCQAFLFRRSDWMHIARRLSALRLVVTAAYQPQ